MALTDKAAGPRRAPSRGNHACRGGTGGPWGQAGWTAARTCIACGRATSHAALRHDVLALGADRRTGADGLLRRRRIVHAFSFSPLPSARGAGLRGLHQPRSGQRRPAWHRGRADADRALCAAGQRLHRRQPGGLRRRRAGDDRAYAVAAQRVGPAAGPGRIDRVVTGAAAPLRRLRCHRHAAALRRLCALETLVAGALAPARRHARRAIKGAAGSRARGQRAHKGR